MDGSAALRSPLILYGTQTGTAADVAASLARRLARCHLQPRVCAMDACPPAQLAGEGWLLCVAATTGHGEAPDTMRRFWRFLLQKRLPNTLLSHLHYACFGLGDSSYPMYNVVAKKLHRRLGNLGATAFAFLGLADDQHPLGVPGAFEPWCQAVLQEVRGEG
jgi:sulfite reductase alpha subunit-like flavoprotein